MNSFLNLQQQPIPKQFINYRQVGCDNRMDYYLYLPPGCKSNPDFLVCIHGISRNAQQQAEYYRHIAKRLHMPLIAPLFDRLHFSGYQRLSSRQTNHRADLMLHKVINEVARLTDAHSPSLHLVGYSGGAQFAHRFALIYPQRVSTLNLCAAGWYTFPDADLNFPRGLKSSRIWPPLKPDLDGFLNIPIQVIIGSEDIARDAALNCKPDIDRQQGGNRLTRAKNWYQAIHQAQTDRQISHSARLTLLAGEGHNFETNITNAGMSNHILDFIDLHSIGNI